MKELLKGALLLMLLPSNLMACGVGGNDDAVATQQKEQRNAQEQRGTYTDVGPVEFEAHMNDDGAVLIDVRTDGEIAEGKIPGSIQIEYNSADMDAKLSELDPSKPVLVYCAAGGRSGKTMAMLQEKGFETVYNLEGGIGAWKKAGKPIE